VRDGRRPAQVVVDVTSMEGTGGRGAVGGGTGEGVFFTIRGLKTPLKLPLLILPNRLLLSVADS